MYMTAKGGGPKKSFTASGETVELHCDVSSSHPPPRIRWFRNGVEVLGVKNGGKEGEFGGIRLSNKFLVNGGKPVTPDHNGSKFSCVADNPTIPNYNITKDFILNVRCKCI